MAEEVKAVKYSVSVEDAVIKLEATVDIVDILEDLAAKSENTIDDTLVQMVKMAAGNLDWKGYAGEHL